MQRVAGVDAITDTHRGTSRMRTGEHGNSDEATVKYRCQTWSPAVCATYSKADGMAFTMRRTITIRAASIEFIPPRWMATRMRWDSRSDVEPQTIAARIDKNHPSSVEAAWGRPDPGDQPRHVPQVRHPCEIEQKSTPALPIAPRSNRSPSRCGGNITPISTRPKEMRPFNPDR
jgi:hypothetical protein